MEVGEEGAEGEEGGGLETELWLLMSRKLASGGRRRTPERVEPSMAFWSWRRRKRRGRTERLRGQNGGEERRRSEVQEKKQRKQMKYKDSKVNE